jgi:hypothetical protein
MAELSQRVQDTIVMIVTLMWAHGQKKDIAITSADILCQDMRRKLTGERPTDKYFRDAGELADRIIAGGWEELAGVPVQEVMMRRCVELCGKGPRASPELLPFSRRLLAGGWQLLQEGLRQRRAVRGSFLDVGQSFFEDLTLLGVGGFHVFHQLRKGRHLAAQLLALGVTLKDGTRLVERILGGLDLDGFLAGSAGAAERKDGEDEGDAKNGDLLHGGCYLKERIQKGLNERRGLSRP